MRTTALSILAILVPGIAVADDISGTWAIEGSVTPSCSFIQTGEKLDGVCRGAGAEGTLTGVISGEKVSWRYDWIAYAGRNPGVFEFSGTVKDGRITGSALINGENRPFAAVHRPGVAPVRLSPSFQSVRASAALAEPVPQIERNPTIGGARVTRPVSNTVEPLIRIGENNICLRFPGGVVRAGVGGRAAVTYEVDAEGKVGNVALVRESSSQVINRYAVECVRSWKFRPPAETGAKAPVSAQAAVLVSYADATGKVTARMQWQRPMTSEASDVGLNDLSDKALACLHARAGVPALARAAAGRTVLKLLLDDGEVSRATVVTPSGSDALDEAAITCYRDLPHDAARAAMMEKLSDANVALNWKVLFYASP